MKALACIGIVQIYMLEEDNGNTMCEPWFLYLDLSWSSLKPYNERGARLHEAVFSIQKKTTIKGKTCSEFGS